MAVQNENVAINVVSSFDAKGFNQAETASAKLTKSVKNLAYTLGVAFSAQAVANFGKQSVQAFIKDEEAATKLSNAVKNLGMEFANPYITDYIKNLEKTTKVADDQLRPAFQSLLQQTGSLAKSQSILSTAIEVSRGSGTDLATVANDLAQAYVGNTKGLKKYYLGLSNAQLKAKSFTEIQKIMNNQFSQSSAAYLATYSGQVGVLSLAWQNFQENVGGALLTMASFGEGSQGQGLSNLASILDHIGSAVTLISKGWNSVASLLNVTGKNGILSKFNPYPSGSTPKEQKTQSSMDKYQTQLAKIEQQRAAQNAAIVKSTKALTIEQKKQASLKKSSTVFDMEQIQLLAALKGQLTTEEQNRVKALLALQNDNADAAKYYSDLVLKAQDDTGRLAALIRNLPTAKNPFADWVAPANMTTSQAVSYTNSATAAADLATQQALNALASLDPISALIDKVLNNQSSASSPTVSVQIDGKEIAAVVQNQALNGNVSTINRAVGDFARVTNS